MAENLDELSGRFKRSAEDFSLAPAPGTWENVARDIRNRERKRRFIIFFLLFGVLLVGGAVLFTNYSTGENDLAASRKNNSTGITHSSISQNNQDEKNEHATNDKTAEQSSPGQNNTVTNIEMPQAPVTEKSPGNNLFEEKTPGNVVSTGKTPAINKEKDPISADETQREKIISSTPILAQATNDSIKTNDNLPIKVAADSLLATNSPVLAKDSLPEKKDTTQEMPFVRRWSFGYGFAPAASFTKFAEQGDYQFIAHYRDSSNKDLLAWNAHFNINYHVAPRIEIFIGLGIINYRQGLLHNQVIYSNDTIPASGPLPPTIVVSKGSFYISGDSLGRRLKNNFYYLQIPIGIRYAVLSFRKCNLGLQPEISFSKNIYSKGYIYDFTTRQYRAIHASDFRSMNIAYGAGLSFRCEIRDNLQLEVMPFFRGMQHSIYASSYALSQKFQQAEVRVSLRYTFSK